MREIKFRAFDPVKNKMRIADICEVDEMAEWITWENPIDSPSNTGVGFEIMQFTGLQDKNGVDIYEGDIVKTDGGSSCGDFDTGVISFVGAAFVVNDGDVNWVFHGINCSYHEVIGNKFESPELLEQ